MSAISLRFWERTKRAACALLVVVLLFGALPGSGHGQTGTEPGTPTAEDPIDLNRATLDQISRLPVPTELAEAIYEYRVYNNLFLSVYDLFKVPGMTPDYFAALRPLVIVAPRFAILDDSQEDDRLEAIYDVVQRLLSQEGVSEGLVDEYVDLLRVPRNVNDLDYWALTSIQNVSPVDAVAILKARQEKPFESTQELRRSDGLSYYGYRNLRDFVRFEEYQKDRWKLAGDLQVRVYNTPYQLDDEDILFDQLGGGKSGDAYSYDPTRRRTRDDLGPIVQDSNDIDDFDKNSLWGRLNIDQSRPYTTNKLRVRLGNEVKTGLVTHRNLGEDDLSETLKWYAGVDDQKIGPLRLHRAYLGNYRVAFGHGLVMDNTDFFQARRTGMGFNVRPFGIRGDISRSDEYALKGGAVEGSVGPVRATGFYSNDDKDAILNPNGSFNRYITMLPRVDNETLEEIANFVRPVDRTHFLPMRDVMNEKVLGANLKFDLLPGTYVGLTGMEMKYKNNAFSDSVAQYFDPDPSTIYIETTRIEPRDADLVNAYDNRNLGTFRDVVGAEAGAVYRNLSFQGEYGKLAMSERESFMGRALHNGPEAWIGSAYLQYENFNMLALYRDYDLGYDNPYNRAFSETNRYDQTLVGDEFRLWNPLFAYLADNEPQAKAERGFFFTTRYQVTRHLTINYLEYDNYFRKTDNTQQQRVTLSVEYRPIFPVRFRVRQRYSDRNGKGADDVRDFKGWDSRYEARFFLSQFDRLDFLYSTTNVVFGPRPRLSGAAEGGVTELGTRAIPAQAFQAKFTHNFTPGLSTTFSSEVYDGFLYNFEDNEFIAVDGRGFRNWALVRSRLSNELSWRLKYTVDHQLPVTHIDVRLFQELAGKNPEGRNAKDTANSFRFQLDYTF